MSQEHIEQALAQYQPTDAAIAEMSNRFATLEVEGLDDRAGLAAVHEARIEVRGIRVQVEKTRKELKKDALEYGRQVDGEAQRIKGLLLEIEEPLALKESIVAKEKERLAAIAAEERKAALQLRLDAMSELGVVPNPLEVQEWTDEEYETQMVALREAYLDHIEEQERRKADEAIAAQELAEEREKLRVEREAMEAGRKADEAIAAQELAEEREKLRVEREAVEAAKELVVLQAEEAEVKLNIERTAIRLARENQEAKEAEAKRVQEIKEAKEQAVLDAKIREGEEQAAREAEEAELERLRPQSEKVYAYADSVDLLKIPNVDCRHKIRDIMSVAAMDVRMLVPSPGVKAEEVPE